MKIFTLLTTLALFGLSGTTLFAQTPSDIALKLSFDGQLRDDSRNNHFISGSGIGFGSDRFGKPDSAGVFNGGTSEFRVPDNGIIRKNDLTISGFFYWRGAAPGQHHSMILNKYQWGDPGDRSFRIDVRDDQLQVGVWFGSEADPSLQKVLKYPVEEDHWYHFAFTITSGNEIQLYVNACMVDSFQMPAPMYVGTQPLHIGNATNYSFDPGNNHHFDGLMDELTVYHRALGAEEIENIYDTGQAGDLPAPRLDLSFDTFIQDDSEYAHLFVSRDVRLVEDQEGKDASAVVFNGQSSYLASAQDQVLTSDAIVAAGWFSPGTSASSERGTILGGASLSGGSFRLSVFRNHLDLELSQGNGNGDRVTLSAPVDPQSWHRFIFTVTEDFASLYLDSMLVDSVTLAAPVQLINSSVTIGADAEGLRANTNFFEGTIAELQVYEGHFTDCMLERLGVLAMKEEDTSTNLTKVDPADELVVSVHPNPANQLVELRTPVGKDFQATLFDRSGRVVQRYAPNSRTIDLSGLTPGMYILYVNFGNSAKSVSVVKQ